MNTIIHKVTVTLLLVAILLTLSTIKENIKTLVEYTEEITNNNE